ncbi:hypothetical protein H920_04033 [Fukomys damarensis]|uniref:Uncharacterized protein n=1 Tax=Fukomys damarensis TaxID=885580 RepID=A0A091DW82_FUKDA|nr:hypothetical protein H920_04033 [Fukomys damarensis]
MAQAAARIQGRRGWLLKPGLPPPCHYCGKSVKMNGGAKASNNRCCTQDVSLKTDREPQEPCSYPGYRRRYPRSRSSARLQLSNLTLFALSGLDRVIALRRRISVHLLEGEHQPSVEDSDKKLD